MPSTDINQQAMKAAVFGAVSSIGTCGVERRPAIIATRKRCEAEGVGLSHYVLMDRKAAR